MGSVSNIYIFALVCSVASLPQAALAELEGDMLLHGQSNFCLTLSLFSDLLGHDYMYTTMYVELIAAERAF